MLNETFYELLEQQITTALAHAADPSLHGHFCDGIVPPEWESDYLPAHVARTRQIRLRAWIDEGPSRGKRPSQGLYPLILQLGPQAFGAYMRQKSLNKFLADDAAHTWVELHCNAKQIVFSLP